MKKFASLLLTVALLAGMIPLMAFPASALTKNAVKYDAKESYALSLDNDTEITDISGNYATFTLKLNGHTLTIKGSVKAQARKLVIKGGGGTIRCEGNGTIALRANDVDNLKESNAIQVENVTFLNCRGSAPIIYVGPNYTFGLGERFGEYKWGVYYLDMSAYFTNVRFENCHNATNGGCIYFNHSAGGLKTTFKNCDFINCGDTAKNGGCIYVNDLVHEEEHKDSICFENCHAYNCKAHWGGFMFINDKVTRINEVITTNRINEIKTINTQSAGEGKTTDDLKETAEKEPVWNVVTGCTAEYGGGIYAADMTCLRNFIFIDNHATKDGGGMYNYTGTGAESTIDNCRFYRNSAGDDKNNKRWGGGLYVNDSDGTVSNCVFYENAAYSTGAELYTNTYISNCTATSKFSGKYAVDCSSGKGTCAIKAAADCKLDSSKGNGAKNSPYLISDTIDWSVLCRMIKDGQIGEGSYINLQNDVLALDFLGLWTGDAKTERPFKGVLDGQGHTVTLYLVNGASNNAAFNFTKGATIKNLTVKGFVSGNSGAAGIVSHAEDTTLENCVNYAEIRGADYVGGIAGWVKNAKITNCANYGNVIAANNNAGGIIGKAQDTTITNCKNTANVSGKANVGGIIGRSTNISYMHCESAGNIVGNIKVGGIVGCADGKAQLLNCLFKGNVEAHKYFGGIIGREGDDAPYQTAAPVVTVQNSHIFGNVNIAKGGIYGGEYAMCVDNGEKAYVCINNQNKYRIGTTNIYVRIFTVIYDEKNNCYTIKDNYTNKFVAADAGGIGEVFQSDPGEYYGLRWIFEPAEDGRYYIKSAYFGTYMWINPENNLWTHSAKTAIKMIPDSDSFSTFAGAVSGGTVNGSKYENCLYNKETCPADKNGIGISAEACLGKTGTDADVNAIKTANNAAKSHNGWLQLGLNEKGEFGFIEETSFAASMLSEGVLWIVIAIAVLALGGVAAIVIVKKKKKTAQ